MLAKPEISLAKGRPLYVRTLQSGFSRRCAAVYLLRYIYTHKLPGPQIYLPLQHSHFFPDLFSGIVNSSPPLHELPRNNAVLAHSPWLPYIPMTRRSRSVGTSLKMPSIPIPTAPPSQSHSSSMKVPFIPRPPQKQLGRIIFNSHNSPPPQITSTTSNCAQ